MPPRDGVQSRWVELAEAAEGLFDFCAALDDSSAGAETAQAEGELRGRFTTSMSLLYAQVHGAACQGAPT